MDLTRALRRGIGGAGAAVALVLALAAPALAARPSDTFPAAGTAMADAYATAVAHWGRQPCDGRVTLRWREMAPKLNALSAWSPGATGDPSEFFACVITFNDTVAYDYPRLCSAMAHEMGHLFGRGHTSLRGELMSAHYSGATPACRTRPAGPVAGAASVSRRWRPCLRRRGRDAATTVRRGSSRQRCRR